MALPNFDKLNSQIKKAGASWVAGRTSYSGYAATMSSSKLLGLAMTPEDAFADLLKQRQDEQQVLFGAAPAVTPPPPSIDWRSKGGKNWLTPVKDQSTCNSCVAFATCGVLESRLQIDNNKPGKVIDLSEAHLFYCGAPFGSCAVGWQPATAMAFAQANGIGLEQNFPYNPKDQVCRPIAPVVKITGSHQAGTSVERKRALLAGPVVAGMAVYQDFFHYQSGVYRHVNGNLTGYHAVCVVGYDDTTACWIVKNSWGTGWGDHGFFRIRYGECGIDTQFPFTAPNGLVLQPGFTF
jgi:C1A family cysteine protease